VALVHESLVEEPCYRTRQSRKEVLECEPSRSETASTTSTSERPTAATRRGDVNIVIELYGADEEPTFSNGEASVEPVHTFKCFGDADTFYHQLKPAFEVIEWVRSS
jgi:hypothetical protein